MQHVRMQVTSTGGWWKC